MADDYLNPLKFVPIFRSKYFERVKPFLDRKIYEIARIEMGNIVVGLEACGLSLFSEVHCGLEYFRCANTLEKQLSLNPINTEDLNLAIEEYEAYQAQTKLPKSLS